MKKIEYIYALLIAALFGWAISSCDDSGIITFDEEERAGLAYDNGETVKTTFTIGLSAPDVSADADLDAQTRALDNANIDYAQPENGGRFKNIVVLLVDHQNRIYGIHCKEFENASGVKEYNVVFSNIDVPKEDVDNKQNYKVYAFGNVCTEHYTAIANQVEEINNNISTTNINGRMTMDNTQVYKYCINATITHDDSKFNNIYNENMYAADIPQFNINFAPGTTYKLKYRANYTSSTDDVTSTGMPENNSVTATVVKGNTQFNVALKRVCARIKITFRNFTGQYINASGASEDNNIYIDEFKTSTNLFVKETNYLYDGNETFSYSTQAPFNLLQLLDCKDANNRTANDHENNKIKNGESLSVSMYVFAANFGTGGCKYNLKVDRGKSLGNRAGNLEDGNVYVMWNDNLDKGGGYWGWGWVRTENSYNRCLGANSSNNIIYGDNLKYGEDLNGNFYNIMPFGTYSTSNPNGNRIFWKYHKNSENSGSFENCKVDLSNDKCVATGYYIPGSGYPKMKESSGQVFTIESHIFEGYSRSYLKISSGSYLMISDDELKSRLIVSFKDEKPYYPWVFFAKYIIKPNQTLRDNKGTITKIERNHSYEFEFSVMPNYDTNQELLVNCVRRQNDVDWSETQK